MRAHAAVTLPIATEKSRKNSNFELLQKWLFFTVLETDLVPWVRNILVCCYFQHFWRFDLQIDIWKKLAN